MDPSFGRRRRQVVRRRPPKNPVEHSHGYERETTGPRRGLGLRSRATPAGTSLLLTVIVGVLSAIGIARVQSTTEVLAMGADITQLTAEQARLLDEMRRLAAERAYLRHPDHIGEVAQDRLGMVPIAPDLVQRIQLMGDTP
jgi:cell division protein FtsL